MAACQDSEGTPENLGALLVQATFHEPNTRTLGGTGHTPRPSILGPGRLSILGNHSHLHSDSSCVAHRRHMQMLSPANPSLGRISSVDRLQKRRMRAS